MKLITEQVFDNLQFLTESDENNQKCCYIIGIFAQGETPNRNNRVYPMEVLTREVNSYNDQFVSQNRSLGELGHPETPVVNLERVSHLVKELKIDGKDVHGKAKLMDTPYGNIAKNLIKEGVKLGVSTRGLGSLKESSDGLKEVQNDFQLNAIDIVADPSAPSAFIQGVYEGKEWIYQNGVVKLQDVESYKKIIQKSSRKQLEENMLSVFNDFLKKSKLRL